MDIEMEEKYIQLRKTKTEIIQDLLGKAVENLYQKYYDEYVDVMNVSDIDFDDGIMCIRIETKYNKNDFKNKYIFKLYLSDFEIKSSDFLEKIKKEVCVNHINLTYNYHEYDKDVVDGRFYEFCEIGFEIKYLDEYIKLDYTNCDY